MICEPLHMSIMDDINWYSYAEHLRLKSMVCGDSIPV